MTFPLSPIQPVGNPTAGYLSPGILSTYQNFYAIPYPIQGLDTSMVHIAPNGNITHLAGPGRGTEGVSVMQQLQGEQQVPFEQIVTESAYQWGGTIERTNYPPRKIGMRIAIGGDNFTTYAYQLCDQRWWAGQDEANDGWLGVYTRFTGWRWIPVRPFKTVDTTQPLDPVAYQNNLAIWDVTWICQRPWYSKPGTYVTWQATDPSTGQTAPQDKAGNYTGTLTLANQGDFQTYVQYIVNGAGTAIVQDNNNPAQQVTLPPIFAADGPCLVDTDPQERTLTASADPIDNEFFQYIRSSSVLNFFLSNIADEGEPWWQRGYVRFLNSVPPQTITQLQVKHTNPNASITALLTQRYRRSR